MAERSPIQELREEHRRLVKDAEDLQTTIGGLSTSPEAAQEATNGHLRARTEQFRDDLLAHFRREEECLFPDVRRAASEGAQRVDILGEFFSAESEDDVSAHTGLAARMDDVTADLASIEQTGRVDDSSSARLRMLMDLVRGLLERRAQKEDALIYPMIERVLSPEQMEQVGQRLWPTSKGADLTESDGAKAGPAAGPPAQQDGDLKGLGADKG